MEYSLGIEEYYSFYNNGVLLYKDYYEDKNNLRIFEECRDRKNKDVFIYENEQQKYHQKVPGNLNIDISFYNLIRYIKENGLELFETVKAGESKDIKIPDSNKYITIEFPYDVKLIKGDRSFSVIKIDKFNKDSSISVLKDAINSEYYFDSDDNLLNIDYSTKQFFIHNSKMEEIMSGMLIEDNGYSSIRSFVYNKKGFKYIYKDGLVDEVKSTDKSRKYKYDYSSEMKADLENGMLDQKYKTSIYIIPFIITSDGFKFSQKDKNIYRVIHEDYTSDQLTTRSIEYIVLSDDDEYNLERLNNEDKE